MYSKDQAVVLLLLECIEKIFLYIKDIQSVDEFEKDIKTFDATLMNFIALGETIAKLSDDFKEKHSEVEWRKIYAFRNVLAHDYFGILPDEVWAIIRKKLPTLKIDLQNIIKE